MLSIVEVVALQLPEEVHAPEEMQAPEEVQVLLLEGAVLGLATGCDAAAKATAAAPPLRPPGGWRPAGLLPCFLGGGRGRAHSRCRSSTCLRICPRSPQIMVASKLPAVVVALEAPPVAIPKLISSSMARTSCSCWRSSCALREPSARRVRQPRWKAARCSCSVGACWSIRSTSAAAGVARHLDWLISSTAAASSAARCGVMGRGLSSNGGEAGGAAASAGGGGAGAGGGAAS